jgi:S-adenosylmethionine:tRNA-ribosyltransferase-isomerase (queuine synthetase)
MLKTTKIIEMKVITREHFNTKTFRLIFLRESGNHHFVVFFYDEQKMIQVGDNWFVEEEDYYGDEEITQEEKHEAIEKIWLYTIQEK